LLPSRAILLSSRAISRIILAATPCIMANFMTDAAFALPCLVCYLLRAILRPSSTISRIILGATPCIMPKTMADAALLVPWPFHYRL
jgi:hypothetical protein